MWTHQVALISVSLPLSQTPAYATRPQIGGYKTTDRGLLHRWCPMVDCTLTFINACGHTVVWFDYDDFCFILPGHCRLGTNLLDVTYCTSNHDNTESSNDGVIPGAQTWWTSTCQWDRRPDDTPSTQTSRCQTMSACRTFLSQADPSHAPRLSHIHTSFQRYNKQNNVTTKSLFI